MAEMTDNPLNVGPQPEIPNGAAAPPVVEMAEPTPLKRVRRRRESLSVDRDAIAMQVCKELDRDLTDRTEWNEARTQRYAKLRGWLPTKKWPWENASNAQVTIMQTDSLRVQDSLYNAVMTATPPITSKALSRADADKQDRVDNLTYHQVFIDQNGEEKIAELATQFTDDGVYLCYVPWIRQKDRIADVRTFDPIPPGMIPGDYIISLLQLLFKDVQVTKLVKREAEGWAWAVNFQNNDGKREQALFDAYVDREGGPMDLRVVRDMETFNGPVLMPKAIEDYALPFRCDNVQPPSPSNPGGAHHVILLDYPMLDEIKRLKDTGFYDLVTDEDLEKMATYKSVPDYSSQNDQFKQVKDALEGTQPTSFGTEGPAQLTRATYFGRYDTNKDGLEEDVIFWVIKETKTLLKAKLLTEMFPAYPPRRPLVAKQFIKVPGRFYGVSLPELLEPIYDQMKILLDQTVDNGTLRNMPWGLVRAHSGLRNELVSIDPGTFYPTANPNEDLKVVTFSNTADALMLNLITLFSQWGDQQTMIGELQLGRVPEGKSAALRTVGGMMSVLQQGDARPEHLLRRFMSGLSEIWAQIHEMNQVFLPKDKEYRIVGVPKSGEDVYQSVKDRSEIGGRFQFEFKATVLNTSKGLLQQSLSALLTILVNPLTIQLGIMQPDGLYRLFRDTTKALGQDPERYLTAPSPGANEPQILAQEAIRAILNGQMPEGQPLEGAMAHLQALQQFMQSNEFGLLKAAEGHLKLFQIWLQKIQQLAMQEQQRAMMMQAVQQFQSSMNPGMGQAGMAQGAPKTGASGNPPVSNNELFAESLPTSGGGAAAGRMAA